MLRFTKLFKFRSTVIGVKLSFSTDLIYDLIEALSYCVFFIPSFYHDYTQGIGRLKMLRPKYGTDSL